MSQQSFPPLAWPAAQIPAGCPPGICGCVYDEIEKRFEDGVFETLCRWELPLGVLGQKGQDFFWHNGFDILLPEPFCDPGQKQTIVLDRIFFPSLTFDNQ